MMTQVPEFLPPTWGAQIGFLAPGFSLTPPSLDADVGIVGFGGVV